MVLGYTVRPCRDRGVPLAKAVERSHCWLITICHPIESQVQREREKKQNGFHVKMKVEMSFLRWRRDDRRRRVGGGGNKSVNIISHITVQLVSR